MIEVHIGVDDVDSLKGGCTTHFTTLLALELYEKGVKFIDYPNLVRLNPAIPWKTRGNGAVALRFYLPLNISIDELWSLITSRLDEYVDKFPDTKHQPSIVLHEGPIPEDYVLLAKKALYDIVPLDLVFRVLNKHSETRTYSSIGRRGVIGALAAIGNTMRNTDYTYEIIAYRREEYWGKPRLVDENSVIEMDEKYREYTILNYDYESSRVLITPRGPDPILLGIRGEDPGVLLKAYSVLKIEEPVDYIAMYRTNQHTDSHIHPVEDICTLKPYMCVSIRGYVATKPRRHIGGHVFFNLCRDTCCITIAVYEPTKNFRNIIEKLEVGDKVEVLGCIRPPGVNHGLTLNLEKINILELRELLVYENPKCPMCGSVMESMGRNKGFRCKKCSYRDPGLKKIPIIVRRDIKPGWYQPPRNVFKHLMKPLERFGREKKEFNEEPIKEFVKKL